MKLLNTFDDRDNAELALTKLSGQKRLASERDGTETIYNLFGQATWSNLYKLDMFNLQALKELLDKRTNGENFDELRHIEIIKLLRYAESSFDLTIPKHWL
ncbi:hypothetical protein NBRC116592_04210 [Colwellia sp. KU-HH00111]|uniref:hypothetical protein n=1 Tax=Colwellia sp. KU-HH00111 TaxID=3127652 RepID=UPI003104A745